jgi:hypothetical protein
MTKFGSPSIGLVDDVHDLPNENLCGGGCYGMDNVKRLADHHPGMAVENADSYAYFMDAPFRR